MAKFITAIAFIIICGIIVVPLLVLLNGYILSYIWLWFAVPLGLPAIGVIWAAGLYCFVAYFRNIPESTDEEPGIGFAKNIGKDLGIFALAYILHRFM